MDAWQNYTYAIVGGEEKEITITPHGKHDLLSRVNSEAGYPSPSDFSRAFKGSLGSSPSEYRKAFLEAGQISKIP